MHLNSCKSSQADLDGAGPAPLKGAWQALLQASAAHVAEGSPIIS